MVDANHENLSVPSTDEQDQPRDDGVLARMSHVSKSFGNLHVLRDVSLEFKKGETTVVLGPSGAGKSVLIRHLVGLLRPDKGEIYVGGVRVDQLSERELMSVRRNVGYMFQLGALFDSMTVAQNIAFPLREHTDMDSESSMQAVKKVLRLVGLPDIENRYPAQLSGGQQRRVAMARAIVLRPEMVLYDEPTTGLDPMRADLISELIGSLSSELGITSLVVTHDIACARKVADRMLLLYNGHVIADAPRDEFLETDNDLVQRFIHGRAEEHDLQMIREAFDTNATDESETL